MSQPTPAEDRVSWEWQLTVKREHLRLIDERIAEYVDHKSVPLDLIRQRRILVRDIRALEHKLGLPLTPETEPASTKVIGRAGYSIALIVIAGLIVLAAIFALRQTPAPTPPISASPSPTIVPSATPTLTPTPDPRAELLRLIETERQAVLSRNLNPLSTIFTSDATKTNAATGASAPVMTEYARTFNNELYQWITHANYQIDLNGAAATVTNDSCGQYHLVDVNKDVPFNYPQSDRWQFKRDSNGRWWITDFTYNLQSTAAQHQYSFEDGTNDCWVARIDQNVPQGADPAFTQERAYQGQGALRLPLDLNATAPRSQIVRWNMPFAGRATAQVYAPPDAPDDLVAGFFAMELDHEPWNYHAADQLITLKRGAWTTVTWAVATTGWAQPLSLLGLEVRRANSAAYRGYVLIDEVIIQSR